MLELSIDELTMTIRISPEAKKNFPLEDLKWEELAEDMIFIFAKNAELERIFGKKKTESRVLQGYSVGYTWGDHDFYFCVCYHPYQSGMHIAVKFSARALSYYCSHSGLKVYELLQKVQDTRYCLRLSRVDCVADFIDEDLDVSQITADLMSGRVAIFREYIKKLEGKVDYKRYSATRQAIMKQDEVQTLYLGSMKSNARMRIYDKKAEQTETLGVNLPKARACKDWVRMELSLKYTYAHQMTDVLLNVKNDSEFGNCIAVALVKKFRFMEVDKNGKAVALTPYTDLLVSCITNNNYLLKASSSRNYKLLKNILHIFQGSGLLNTLYKIKMVWGNDAVKVLLDYIMDFTMEWRPNEDCRYWLIHNESDYRHDFPDFEDFMREVVTPYL